MTAIKIKVVKHTLNNNKEIIFMMCVFVMTCITQSELKKQKVLLF